MTCCKKFVEWTCQETFSNTDEYIYYDDKIKRYRGDGYQDGTEFIFEYCPFCGTKQI